jgi:predicted SnoaL-like aldol condensation-catalyzing enzyme
MRAADASEEGRADAQFLAGFVDRFPALRFVVRRVVAEGDLVVTHGVLTLDAEDRGSAVADVMRFEDGRVVEHWDVVQALPDDPANANGMC